MQDEYANEYKKIRGSLIRLVEEIIKEQSKRKKIGDRLVRNKILRLIINHFSIIALATIFATLLLIATTEPLSAG
jgi:hypothetical protein